MTTRFTERSANAPSLSYKNPGYDTEKDLRAVATLVNIPTAIVTGASQPFDDMKGFVQWAKKNPKAGGSDPSRAAA